MFFSIEEGEICVKDYVICVGILMRIVLMDLILV